MMATIAAACLSFPVIAAAGNDAETLHVIVLSNERPVFIRLQVRVDGLPFQDGFNSAWSDYLEHLFKLADRNKDGGLNAEEAARLPAPSAILTGGWGDEQGGLNFAFNFRVLDRDADGGVSLDELAAYYKRYAGGSFRTQAVVGPRTAADARLFDRLDQDRDGSLSKDELASATSQLKSLDSDGDDTITAAEIAGTPAPAIQQPPPAAAAVPESAVIVFSPRRAPADLAEVLMTRYGKRLAAPGVPTLRQADIGLDQARFAKLDRNQDGALDAGELSDMVSCPPDLILTFLLGDAKDGKAVEIVSTYEDGAVRLADNGCIQCGIAKVHLELQHNASKLRILGAGADRYVERLKANTSENAEGVLERKAALQDPLFAPSFDLMDVNDDGNLTEAELRAYLDSVHARHIKLISCRPAIVFSDEGQGLFGLLDQDRDGRLSVRELREAERLPEKLDMKAPLARDAIPRSFRIGIGQSTASLSPHGGNIVVMPHDRDLIASGVGPIWFRKMDRNRDGDLSPNEFLGTPADFRRLDADGDGLVSADEAEKAG